MLKIIQKSLRNKKGFTLIELIVVIGILAILTAIAVPRLAGFTDKAKEANDEQLAAIFKKAFLIAIASGDIQVPSELGGTTIKITNSKEGSGKFIYDPDKLKKSETEYVALNELITELVDKDAEIKKSKSINITIDTNGDVKAELVKVSNDET